jgi:hypothetical protein
MNLSDLVKIANQFDDNGDVLAANVIDMAVKEAKSEGIGVLNVLHKFANMLDSDGHHDVVNKIDEVIQKGAAAVSNEVYEHLYDYNAHRDQSLFQALEDEASKAKEPELATWEGGNHPLLTRYSPDYPGVMMQRISDGVYQDLLSKKVYDFRSGFISDTGERYYGGSVAHQTPTALHWKNSPQILESKHLRVRPR